jgi:acyl-CoA dehydrogenase
LAAFASAQEDVVHLDLSAEDTGFRDELRRWLDENLVVASNAHEWHRRLVAGHWAVPAWPLRWGGRACTLQQEIIFNQEMGSRDAPGPRNAIGLYNIGPMLLQAGTQEQQERYLPKMVTAEEIWCQGFSEPNAGSDLAALETRAEDRGDHWLINGQKTWNTFGNEADFCLALVRTDPQAPKHKGISAFIVDLHQPGVETRPLREITGDDGFNEIFFTDAVVPKQNLVGPLHAGWKVAMSTLLYERLGTMKLGIQLARRLDSVVALAKELGRSGEPLIRQAAAALGIQVELMQLLAEDALDAMQRGHDPGATLPLGKLQWSYLMQDLAELALRIEGPRAQLYRGSKHEVPGNWQYHCVYSRMTTIGAGTTQVQKNIMAYRILGLPREADTAATAALSRDRPLDETRGGLRETVRRFVQERCPIRYVRSMLDDPRGTTDAVWSELVELGLTKILVPEEHGGLGLGYREMGIVLEELGRGLYPGPFVSSALGAVAALSVIATNDEQAALLPHLADGSRVGALALFEPEIRYDWQQVRTQALRKGTEWRLSGAKLVPDGAAADLLLVTARVGDQIGLFAVEAAHTVIAPLITVDGTRKLAEVALHATPARRIGEGDVSSALADVVDRLLVGYVVDAVGAADHALDLATDYAKVRRQFDRPIGSFQAVQHLLADMLRNVELARSGVYAALRLADGNDRVAFHRAATVAKAFASDALYRVTADAIQVFGGIGFTWEHDAHLYYKRAMSMQHAFGGTPEFQDEYARLLFGS